MHQDAIKNWGNEIVGVNTGAHCQMAFADSKDGAKTKVYIPRRSVYIMTRPTFHEVLALPAATDGAHWNPLLLRVSLTLRRTRAHALYALERLSGEMQWNKALQERFWQHVTPEPKVMWLDKNKKKPTLAGIRKEVFGVPIHHLLAGSEQSDAIQWGKRARRPVHVPKLIDRGLEAPAAVATASAKCSCGPILADTFSGNAPCHPRRRSRSSDANKRKWLAPPPQAVPLPVPAPASWGQGKGRSTIDAKSARAAGKLSGKKNSFRGGLLHVPIDRLIHCIHHSYEQLLLRKKQNKLRCHR